MTRDDIIRMARESGIIQPEIVFTHLERFAALVAAAEREACVYRANIALLGADRGLANRVNQAIRNRT